jgi:hypothetical protein
MAKNKKDIIDTALHTKDAKGDISYLVGLGYLEGLESQLIDMQENEELSKPNKDGGFNQTPFEGIIQDLKIAKDSWNSFVDQNPDVDKESLGMLTKHFMSLNSHIVKINTNRVNSQKPRKRHVHYEESIKLLKSITVKEVHEFLDKKYSKPPSLKALYDWNKEIIYNANG